MPLLWLPDEIMHYRPHREKLSMIMLHYYDYFLCVCYNANFNHFLPWDMENIENNHNNKAPCDKENSINKLLCRIISGNFTGLIMGCLLC